MIFIDSNVPMYLVGVAHPNKDRAVAVTEMRSARALPGSVGRLSARDALHLAVMQKAGVSRILSFDDGFDSLLGIERLK